MFMAKCRWVENGESPTKYYLNLKKKNYKKRPLVNSVCRVNLRHAMKNKSRAKSKIISRTCTNPVLAFSHEEYEEFIHSLEIPRLSNEDRDRIEETLKNKRQGTYNLPTRRHNYFTALYHKKKTARC